MEKVTRKARAPKTDKKYGMCPPILEDEEDSEEGD